MALPTLRVSELEDSLREGDIVFTRIACTPFRQLAKATGTWTNHVGIVVGFDDIDLRLWNVWYFGSIPWQRTTVTPASLYASPSLSVVFDGFAKSPTRRRHYGRGRE